MLGLLYILLCFTVGWAIATFAFPDLAKLTEKDFEKRKISISPYLILFPSWYVTGTLAVTWATYFTAYFFRNNREPLHYANLIIMPIAAVVSVLAIYIRFSKHADRKINLLNSNLKVKIFEFLLVAAITTLAFTLMWSTFFIHGNTLYVGNSVYSDFSAHIGMIRSFSYGNNFPTAYSHYGGEDIRYHFMIQFLVGNLEYLGLRLDYAFNISSMLGFISAFLMLYILAVKISGKISVGFLSCLFFAFRSAKTLFTYLSKVPMGTNIFKALAKNISFISDTPHEEWGLWNLNVYANQRHLVFGLAVFFLVIIIMLPHLYEMFEAIKQQKFNDPNRNKKNYHKGFFIKSWEKIQVLFFTKEAWAVTDLRRALATGVLLGSLGFFHGAALIGCLTVMFVVAVLSARRLEFLIVAVITMTLSLLQTSFFIKGSAVHTQFFFGFIAENRTLFGVASYLERLLGILPFVLLAAFLLEKSVGKYLLIAFTAPLIFAFTISMTPDVTVNHKYIMMSCILLGIFAASLVVKIFEKKELLSGLIGIILVLILTTTGIYDYITVLRQPRSTFNLNDPLTMWIHENSDSKDLFLTDEYALNQVVLGGAMLYEGWTYYPWSAGYDTAKRVAQVKAMYEADNPGKLKQLVDSNHIRFIIVDKDNRTNQSKRTSDNYTLNEANIKATYQCVYTQGSGEDMTSIYDTEKPLE